MHGEEFPNVPTHGVADGEPAAEPVVDEDARVVRMEKAAVLLGEITYREVAKMCRRGELESIKVGRRRMVMRQSIDDYIDARLQASRALRVAA